LDEPTTGFDPSARRAAREMRIGQFGSLRILTLGCCSKISTQNFCFPPVNAAAQSPPRPPSRAPFRWRPAGRFPPRPCRPACPGSGPRARACPSLPTAQIGARRTDPLRPDKSAHRR
jgi:hypothetical protein